MAENALTLPASAHAQPRLPALLARHRVAAAIVTSLAGVAAAWATGSPFALLAPAAALFLHAPVRAVPPLLAAGALAFAVGVLLAVDVVAAAWPAFLGLSLCVGAMLAASRAVAGSSEGEQAAFRIVEGMPSHGWSADPGGRYTYLNPRTLAFLGRGPAELDPAEDEFGWRSVVHPDDYDTVAARWRQCLATGEPYHAEHRLRRVDGVWRWFRNTGWSSRDAAGRIVAWYGTVIDIDDEKRAEAALQARERELTQLVDMVPSHLWRLAPDGEPVFFNRRMVDFLGFDIAATERPGVSRLEAFVADSIHPEDAAAFAGAMRGSLATGTRFAMRYRLRRADGAWHWMSSRAEPLRDESGAIVQWYGLCHDIDDQVRAEESLRRSELRLQQMIDTMPALIWCMEPDGTPSYLNRRLRDLLGLELADLTGSEATRSLADIHPDDRQAVEAALGRSLATGAPFAMTYRQRRSDDSYRWTEGRTEALRDESGSILQWYGVCVDVDDQMRLYSDLEEREARIRRLVDSDIIGIVIWDLDGRLIDANDAFLDMIQYDRADLAAGLRWFDLTPPEWQAVHAHEEAEELARTGKMQAREKEYFRKDGSRVPVLIGAACFEGQSRQGVAYILDLTKRKRAEAAQARAEEALRQASVELSRATQAASLAELSASIAHEVNQPLAAIVANSSACLRWLSATPPNIERAKITAERIVRDANSAADVVDRIRAVFRRSPERPAPAELGAIVREVRDLMAEEATRRGVRFGIEAEAGLPAIALDRVQIQQVLVNLIRNGVEAMEETPGDRVLRIRVLRDGDALRTEVADTGPGLAVPERAFQPFFTTKAAGMGMGLAICRSIVEAHGGRLWAEAAAPHGATFVFTLPIAAKGA